MDAPNTTTKALLRGAIDSAFQAQVAAAFVAKCDAIVQEREGRGDAVLIALEVRDAMYGEYRIEPSVNMNL